MTPFRRLRKLWLRGIETYWKVALLVSDTDLTPKAPFSTTLTRLSQELFMRTSGRPRNHTWGPGTERASRFLQQDTHCALQHPTILRHLQAICIKSSSQRRAHRREPGPHKAKVNRQAFRKDFPQSPMTGVLLFPLGPVALSGHRDALDQVIQLKKSA